MNMERTRMKLEFRKRDIVVRIGDSRLYVVTDTSPSKYHYGLQEVDRFGNDLYSFFGLGKHTAHREFVRVGTWKGDLPDGVKKWNYELDIPLPEDLITEDTPCVTQ